MKTTPKVNNRRPKPYVIRPGRTPWGNSVSAPKPGALSSGPSASGPSAREAPVASPPLSVPPARPPLTERANDEKAPKGPLLVRGYWNGFKKRFFGAVSHVFHRLTPIAEDAKEDHEGADAAAAGETDDGGTSG
ncbi:hypothetical protein KR018_000409 [Drosophila ironensis]|nr:hypothetical protein KR018_000409 [Drosophila ironensis]